MYRITVLFSLIMAWILPAAGRLQSGLESFVGGDYVIRSGESFDGNLVIAFAQITVEAGASVNGNILAVSSNVHILGSVTGNINCIECDVALHPSTGVINGNMNQFNLLNWVILFPPVVRLP